jgi:hypothetical protein
MHFPKMNPAIPKSFTRPPRPSAHNPRYLTPHTHISGTPLWHRVSRGIFDKVCLPSLCFPLRPSGPLSLIFSLANSPPYSLVPCPCKRRMPCAYAPCPLVRTDMLFTSTRASLPCTSTPTLPVIFSVFHLTMVRCHL